MKTYLGDRTIDGIVVTVDGRPLDERTEVAAFSRNGFEWSYEGPEPRQLALALLADHFGDAARAGPLCEGFMRAVVANLANEWRLTSADIDRAVLALSPGAPAGG